MLVSLYDFQYKSGFFIIFMFFDFNNFYSNYSIYIIIKKYILYNNLLKMASVGIEPTRLLAKRS